MRSWKPMNRIKECTNPINKILHTTLVWGDREIYIGLTGGEVFDEVWMLLYSPMEVTNLLMEDLIPTR